MQAFNGGIYGKGRLGGMGAVEAVPPKGPAGLALSGGWVSFGGNLCFLNFGFLVCQFFLVADFVE